MRASTFGLVAHGSIPPSMGVNEPSTPHQVYHVKLQTDATLIDLKVQLLFFNIGNRNKHAAPTQNNSLGKFVICKPLVISGVHFS